MDVAQIDRLLNQGERVGFRRTVGDPEYLGWILISKVDANRRLLELLDSSEAPELVEEERRRLREPYLILRIELKRSVHESGEYETEQDYRLKEKFWFADLAGVAAQLERWGYSLQDAKESRQLDAP